MSDLKTLSQKRAQYAFECVNPLKGIVLEKYLTIVRSLPSMVRINGLGQTIAFLMSKKEHELLVKHLTVWLCEEMTSPVYSKVTTNESPKTKLLQRLVSSNALSQQRATIEIEELSVWLKRFAESAGKNESTHAEPSVPQQILDSPNNGQDPANDGGSTENV
jgi:CRISPR-associated protein Cmr5